MEALEVKRMNELEEENTRLKKIYANLAMAGRNPTRPVHKKSWPCTKRQLSEEVIRE